MIHALPPLEMLQCSDTRLRLRGVVPDSLPCFEGHFPDQPVVPGVVQLGWIIELVRCHSTISPVAMRVDALKFHRVITPGTELDITVELDPARERASFMMRSQRDVVHSSGRIQFGDPDSR